MPVQQLGDASSRGGKGGGWLDGGPPRPPSRVTSPDGFKHLCIYITFKRLPGAQCRVVGRLTTQWHLIVEGQYLEL